MLARRAPCAVRGRGADAGRHSGRSSPESRPTARPWAELGLDVDDLLALASRNSIPPDNRAGPDRVRNLHRIGGGRA
jgi:hypothetical protein